ncbi:hypothetical protein IU494_21000 [Nocardia terpenica]|uniref:hypothetical protein n=1 Tax=Nocardia terpenica TaxID=455432 RepID=UPI001894933A|nr:hypothetical protein [Nocardia terpenica]MBF6062000.1 hypothetical protein [Nocardia terpenica]MBF6110420.1 hypothetical protein [Nocardia terpenica]MBF6120743.1 hypothetical protein [Nocardia terpenica]
MRALLSIVLLCAVLAAGTGAGIATAAPAAPSAPADLPNGFPADLHQFVAGTSEFKSAWFSGECANRGGDVGAYINAALTVEDRLLYWTATGDQKRALLHGHVPDTMIGPLLDQGGEPPKDALPSVFPAGDATFHLPSPACADDLKRWARTPAWNAWGFDWVTTPDEQSLHEIAALHAFDTVPAKAWTDPCSVNGTYCAHAFFVDCRHADTVTGDQVRCLKWNTAVGNLFVGTADWIDRNTGFSDRMSKALIDVFGASGTEAFVKAFAWVVGKTSQAIRFVDDPQSVIDDWANASKDSAADLSTRVLDGLAATGRFDPAAGWFLHWYAISTGIGVMVMGLMTLFALWRASARGETMKTLAADLLGYLPAGVLLMLFAPMIAGMLIEIANSASESIARTAGPDMGQMLTNLKLFVGQLTATHLVGGVLVGLLLFLLLIVGALSVFFGLLMHQVALPALAIASGIGFGMWVHPNWRKKALRPVLLFLAIVFSKPLLFLLLATLTGTINAGLTGEGGGDQLSILSRLCLIVVAFLVAGLAPWSLLRYAPLLPSRSDATGFGQSGSLLAGAAGGMGSAMWWNRGMGGRYAASRIDRTTAGTDSAPSADSPDPKWRTRGRSDGKSETEAGLGQTLARSTSTGEPSTARRSVGSAGRTAASMTRRLGSAAKTTAVVAAPIAAQAASGALNKARSVAEAAPGEAEANE